MGGSGSHPAKTIAKLFVEHVICRHGSPSELLSDRGANFSFRSFSRGVQAL